jgi:hypothetical protein
VDGQQRTTALSAALLDLDHAGDGRWLAYFDPAEGAFLPGPVQPLRVGQDIPLSVLGDLKRFGRWLREASTLDEELIGRAEEAQQRLLDYSIPAYVVDTEDEQALRGVFARLNSTGARMRADEVFQALLGAPSAGGQRSLDLVGLLELMSNGRIAREIFRPQETLAPETGHLMKTAANRVLLGSGHTGLSNDLKTWCWENDAEAIDSHLIDEVSFAFLQRGEVDSFLDYRSSAVSRLVAGFLEKKAGWDEPDVRPLSAYLEQLEF